MSKLSDIENLMEEIELLELKVAKLEKEFKKEHENAAKLLQMSHLLDKRCDNALKILENEDND